MYDVQPADEPGWTSPPFAAELRDLPGVGPAVVARGSANSKGCLAAQFIAVEILRELDAMPVTVALLVEGEEELGSPNLAATAGAQAALEQVGLTPPDLYLDRYPHELSGGQRQRVAIAASLVLDLELLVADEPVSMLDVSVRAGVLALLDGLRRGRKLGILMITHDLSTAASFADRIAVMYLGRIVEEGPAARVVRAPQHPYTKALLSVVPRRDPRDRTGRQVLQGETPNPVRVPSGCRFHPRCPEAIERCPVEDQVLHRARGEPPDHQAACLHV